MKTSDNVITKLDREDAGSEALRMAQRTNNEVAIVLEDGAPVFDTDSLRSHLDRKIRRAGSESQQKEWDSAEQTNDLEGLYRRIMGA